VDKKPQDSDDDMAGIVEAVGDRVAAFHEMSTANESFAEYAIAWA